MTENERATLTRRLKVNEYNNSEKAVMAIPAIKIWFMDISTFKESGFLQQGPQWVPSAHQAREKQRNVLIGVKLVVVTAELIAQLKGHANCSYIFRGHF